MPSHCLELCCHLQMRPESSAVRSTSWISRLCLSGSSAPPHTRVHPGQAYLPSGHLATNVQKICASGSAPEPSELTALSKKAMDPRERAPRGCTLVPCGLLLPHSTGLFSRSLLIRKGAERSISTRNHNESNRFHISWCVLRFDCPKTFRAVPTLPPRTKSRGENFSIEPVRMAGRE
jgi:hypothetical protein